MNKNTTVQWNGYMREIVVSDLLQRRSAKIGGIGKIVEVDESLFSKRKNNAGRVLPQQWIFGGICRETNASFLVTVENRSAETLLKMIAENVEQGSTIISDCWRGYNS